MIEVLTILVLGLLVLMPISLVIMLLIYAAQESGTVFGACQRCGYCLEHLADDERECPECGHPFEIDDGRVVSRS
jgi:rRNA maturation endonuclease Nob1